MELPDLSSLSVNDPDFRTFEPTISDDIKHATERYLKKLKIYAQSLPYPIESNAEIQGVLDVILLRISQAVEAKDYEPGLMQWDALLSHWLSLKYPLPKDKRIALAKLYFHVSTTPGMSMQVVASCIDTLGNLIRSKKKLTIEDMRLPWKPVFNIIDHDFFLTRREFEYSQLSWYMAYVAESVRRFFHPAAIDEMLSTFLPKMNGADLNTILFTEYQLLTFLPLTHPQSYLSMLCRVWESINSYMYDERMLQFLASCAQMHVDPTVSDPAKIKELPDDQRSEDEGRPNWSRDDLNEDQKWTGIYKDVGIFTEHEWNLIMCKCLASMEIPLADSGSLTTGPTTDMSATFELDSRLPKAQWRIPSLARIIVYSMAPDGVPSPQSTAPTPMFTPQTSGASTPQLQNGSVSDYLSANLHKKIVSKVHTYLAGSKALDSLARLIASLEHFFHPTNSGSWTVDLSAFLKHVVFEFNRRWHEEKKPDCKTPMERRLTPLMRYELVKCLRTVAFVAMFSQDSSTVSHIQSCLKSMCVMEPALILDSIFARAIPALNAFNETERTLAMIRALAAIAPSIVSRQVYYPGAKYLIPILHSLIPGIDLNDPTKTLYTSGFISEVAQYIMFSEVTLPNDSISIDVSPEGAPYSNGFANEQAHGHANGHANGRANGHIAGDGIGDVEVPMDEDGKGFGDVDAKLRFDGHIPIINVVDQGIDLQLSGRKEEDDKELIETTADFAEWIASFIRQVIQLLENLPEEHTGRADGASEAQTVDDVTGACSQICIHLSDSLFDLVLNLIYDYATTNIRHNAVRAIHQLVECVANADPEKTMVKFFPYCARSITAELDHGASSVRTTSETSPLPSDATLHWNLAILRGVVYNDGRVVLRFKDQFLSLFKYLHEKTFSARAYSWSGKILSSTLLTLTHTYPLENRFVNPDEWNSPDFKLNHYKHWGKLYDPEDVKLSWHVPSSEEIDFALQLFRELVEPTLTILDDLLKSISRGPIWRNDFCRHLCLVHNAFAGIPTLLKDIISPEDLQNMTLTSDILNEVPEMIACVLPIASGFCLTDPGDERFQYMKNLRTRFGEFLHRASVSLQGQGEENTVDAVQALLRAIQTYMLNYGDSRDSSSGNADRYSNELNIARHYAGQKKWPRAVLVRRARHYHSVRLHWNSMERTRGQVENDLIDDVIEWSMWHYPTVRQSSQTLLESLFTIYDGVRGRALPRLYKALQPKTEDDRMKGALWTLNLSSFVRNVVADATLAPEYIKNMLACQHNEKPSIQNRVNAVIESSLRYFPEPCYLVYSIENASTEHAISGLRACLPLNMRDNSMMARVREKRIERIELMNQAAETTISEVIKVVENPKTHWRYGIAAIRFLRTLARRDVPISAAHVKLFLEKSHDSNMNMRYYARRAVMKALRYLKLRTYCQSASDLVLAVNHNPLKQRIAVERSHSFTAKMLESFKSSLQPSSCIPFEAMYYDDTPGGWLAWGDGADLYKQPQPSSPTFAWEDASSDAVSCVSEVTQDTNFWKKLSTHFAEENQETVVFQSHISTVKSIFQLLEDKPFEFLKPTLEGLLAEKEQNKQRAAAELLAGVLNGSKHWNKDAQDRLWKWLSPQLKKIFGPQIKTDTLSVWTSFIEYMFYHKDPRRLQPLVDHIIGEFKNADFNGQSSFDSVKVLNVFRAFYSQLGWKFSAWSDDILDRCWAELRSEHRDVRSHMAEILEFCSEIKWQPQPSLPSVEVFVMECRTADTDFDIMGMRGTCHMTRVLQLASDLKIWRKERLPGVRAFQSTYDRVGIAVCKWFYSSLHSAHAISTFDYILPLLPELFRFTEINDNDELAHFANVILVRMCGVTVSRSMVNPILEAIFEAIRKAPSWKVRLKALPVLQVFYFRQLPLISELKVLGILEVLCECLDDEVVEVREMVGRTLSGILRLSPRRNVLDLKNRFTRLAKKSRIPQRDSDDYGLAIRQRHAAIIGICSLIDSFPYTVEKWMPELLTDVLAEHTYDPIPISTTVRKCASNFKKTHQDTWHEDSVRFKDNQLAALSTLLTGSSYYA